VEWLAWLDPKFRDWDVFGNISPTYGLPGCNPAGRRKDEYGTNRQIEIAQEECYCPVDVTIVPGAGHSPHREAPEATLNAIFGNLQDAFCTSMRARRGRGPPDPLVGAMRATAAARGPS